MLYVPPQYAHEGVALDACTTYSIGFRAPATPRSLPARSSTSCTMSSIVPGRYADPDLTPPREPAEIDGAMRRRCERMLRRVRWNRATIARFLGCWLVRTEAKRRLRSARSHLANRAAFGARAAKRGVRLDTAHATALRPDAPLHQRNALRWPAARRARALKALANAGR